MTNLSQFIIKVSYHYPELYRYIFAEERMKRIPQEQKALRKFMEEHDLTAKNHSYGDIWDFLVANEDKHDWWML